MAKTSAIILTVVGLIVAIVGVVMMVTSDWKVGGSTIHGMMISIVGLILLAVGGKTAK